MAAGKFKLYHSAKEYEGDGTIDYDTNTFKWLLFLSTSNCNTLTHTVLADLTNQHANANGYTTGGLTATGVTWTSSAGTTTLDCDNPSWTATGGSIVARFAVLIRSGTVNSVTDALVGVILLDTTPADVTATSGNPFTVTVNTSGLFSKSGATSD